MVRHVSKTHSKTYLLGFLALSVSVCLPQPAVSQTDAPGGTIEEVITVGTRNKERTAIDSPVPVDAFTSEQLQSQGTGDFNVALRNLIPSFNVAEQSTADGSAFIRPVTLRGMAPDQVLVLVNGKRRHRSALVNLSNGGGSLAVGSQGPDIANIPSIALKGVEVLRDGAGAQYGSDAIAGVMNFVLKENTEGLEVITQYGEYYEGESEYKVSANYGGELTEHGFFNVTAEYAGADPTSRGIQRADAQALIDAGTPGVPEPAQRWGKTDTESGRFFWHAGLTLSDSMEAYMFGNYSDTESKSSFFYRNPFTNSAFADVPLDFDDPVGGGTFNFRSRFPGGFTPEFSGQVTDFSQIGGVRGELDNGMTYDFSLGYGRNKIDYSIRNTINPSLGPDSPTSFRPGSLIQTEKTANVDITYPYSDTIHVAAGLEFREDTYEIVVGNEESYEIGRFGTIVDSTGAAVINPATGTAFTGLPVGSNGFPGFSPDQAGRFQRHNYSAYVDVEVEPTEKLLFNVAGRYEDFSDFGSTINGKVAARYFAMDNLTIRGAVGTGFKAPTPGQASTTNIGTRLFPPSLALVAVGILPPTDPLSQFFGGKGLDPEESFSYSAGFVFTPMDNLTLSVDYYRIELDDRISLSGSINIGPAEVAQLQAAGIARATDFARIQFYTNAFDTVTDGIDVVSNYKVDWSGATTSFDLSYAYNRNRITRFDPGVITRDRELEIEDALPAHRVNFSVLHRLDKWSFMVSAKYFSSVLEADIADPALDELAGAEVLVDAEVTYDFNDSFTLSVGAHNIFDNFPDRNNRLLGAGLPYFRQSPVGWQGGQWYARLRANF